MKSWIMDLCPLMAEWQAEIIAEHAEAMVERDTALLRQALEALERADKISGYPNNKKVIAALKERLK